MRGTDVAHIYSWAVDYVRGDGSKGAVMGACDTRLNAALAAAEMQEYYLAIEGYSVANVLIEPMCASCRGSGRRPHRRARYRWVVCGDCKGRPVEVKSDGNP